jgi:type IV pilus assembly protein PilA
MSVRDAKGFTLIELLLVVAIIGILAGLSAPFLMAAKAASHEASAIGSLRAINSAQASFATTCGGGLFSMSLPTLVSQGFVSPDMVSTPKSGYLFEMTPGADALAGPSDCTGAQPQSAYYVSAVAVSVSTGRRGFATNAHGTIWQDESGGAPAEPFTVSATVSPIHR